MKLKYNKDGNFKIVQFTDLHLGEYPFKEKDHLTLKGIEKVLINNNIDLIVITGDIVYSLPEHGALNIEESFKAFIHFLNSYKIPVALTLGNHDSEYGISRNTLYKIAEENLEFKIEESNVFIINDRKNYTVELFDSKTNEVKQLLFIIDSGDYSETEHSYYAWILPEQISWYKNIGDKYKRDNKVKRHLMFQNIPISEYWLSSQNIVNGNFNEDFELNLTWINQSKNELILPNKKGVCSPSINSGLFLQILLNEETWGMFVGHDHDNNFDSIYKGIHLVYGQSSGYNTYGTEPKGARIIELNENDNKISTYSVYFE